MNAATTRLSLSLVCEPGDPRLHDILNDVEPAELLRAVRTGSRVAGRAVPEAWTRAAHDLDDAVPRIRERAAAAGLRWIVPGSSEWPTQLDDLALAPATSGSGGAPLGLWVLGKGHLATLAATSVSVVGARDCTAYGAEQAAEIAADAASAGHTVVSGAAFGVDACAHRGALAVLRPTVAVLACDAATAYPKAHAALLHRIADDGVVVSEQAPGRSPTKARFLARNRVIAALTRGTVVVEARRRSGALNTLAWADQLGRITMAVPGPVTSQQSTGTHEAIRDGKAVLVGSGTDVIDALGGMEVAESAPDGPAEATAFDALTADQARVLDALEWKTPLTPVEVALRAGTSRASTLNALRRLGEGGWADSNGSGQWLLARRADLESSLPSRTVGE